ncbi:hypothetical protein QCA50_018989 [Cerrena zonata]|uniref:Uncharacterized protein n=1 Tax=Cerrena zonata TaxID=2478898 RepID=A0AAW0FKA7_9APHY
MNSTRLQSFSAEFKTFRGPFWISGQPVSATGVAHEEWGPVKQPSHEYSHIGSPIADLSCLRAVGNPREKTPLPYIYNFRLGDVAR